MSSEPGMRALVLASLLLLVACTRGPQPAVLLNASHDPTREFYQAYDKAFVAHWRAREGSEVVVQSSHGGSGKQARAVIDGLRADIVTLALAGDVDQIANAGLLAPDWQSRLPNNSSPYTSTIVFLVLKGNPKGIRDWGDLARPGIGVVTPNPKTSGGARWNYLAAWAWGERAFNNDRAQILDFIGKLYRNAPILDTGARGSTTTFAQRRIGDVLVAWENEAFLVLNGPGGAAFELVTPSISVRAEPPVALVDHNVDAKGTRAVAHAYLEFLYSPTGQQLAARHFYRPSKPELADPVDLARFGAVELVDIAHFGGWAKAQAEHFAEGGLFDQIFEPAP